MAHAGNPTGLAQQAGAAQPWKTVLAAIAVLAIGLALVIAVMFINSRAVAPATGRDDSVIEAQRDATLLSGKPAAGVPAAPAVIDESYNTGEGLRGIARATGRDAGVPAAPAVIDESYYTSAGPRDFPAVPADMNQWVSTHGK
jgi:hypothetical protein